nr:hypothetical protein [Frondihabitans sucicola]
MPPKSIQSRASPLRLRRRNPVTSSSTPEIRAQPVTRATNIGSPPAWKSNATAPKTTPTTP